MRLFMVRTFKLQNAETYVVGPPPERVRITGVSYGTVVAGHDFSEGKGFVGFFQNPESEALEQMCREVREKFDTGRLELTLVGMVAIPGGNSTGIDYVSGRILEVRKSVAAALRRIGVQPIRMQERYQGSGLASVTFNLGTGRMQVITPSSYDGSFGKGGNDGAGNQSTVNSEQHGPLEVDERGLVDPPEPNKERFWKRAGKLRK